MMQYFIYSDYLIWIIMRVVVTIVTTLLVTKIFHKIWNLFDTNTLHQKFIYNVLHVAIWTIGIIVTLQRIPQFADAAVALVAGSGIIALTIGLAAQESLSNALNGLFISISKPFEVGDRIHLVNANITGFVEDITIRHTVIRTFMNSRIIIPNSVINQELIENSNFCNPQASSFIDVIVTYDSDIKIACDIMARVIGDHENFIDTRTIEQLETDPKVPVFVRTLGLYGVELRASMWTANIANNFAACSDVRKSIFYEFKKAGICIASGKIIDSLIQRSNI
ncbi:MAG: mechanosensitive ion channel family protein [Defluviitaleaceae bacterium]|nr:mechanosensitive ion channel family protein [Defluviitaleaceae bacterium]